MNVSKDIFLKQLVQLPELSENTIAYIFADNPDIDISSRERFFENIISYFNRFKENKPDISQSNVYDPSSGARLHRVPTYLWKRHKAFATRLE